MIIEIEPAKPYEVAKYKLQFNVKQSEQDVSLMQLMDNYMDILYKEMAKQQEMLIMNPSVYASLNEDFANPGTV